MPQKTRSDDRGRATEPEFYLPAGVTSPSKYSRVDRIWAKLFDPDV